MYRNFLKKEFYQIRFLTEFISTSISYSTTEFFFLFLFQILLISVIIFIWDRLLLLSTEPAY